MSESIIEKAYIVPGQPHILLAPEKSPHWQALNEAYAKVRQDIETLDADLILYFSTQWLSVIGYLFQADPRPKWTLVDGNWHELGSMPYDFVVDSEFASTFAGEVSQLGHHVSCVNYRGFPIDTGTVVAQKLLNPDNRIPAAMVSCNMYSEKNEIMRIGQAGIRALEKAGKRAVVVLVSNLSSRFHVTDIDPMHDKISSAKDHEWNLKVCELLTQGRLEDVSQCTRDFAREANADMGGRGIWWLNGLLGQSNDFRGEVFGYGPVWGSGCALIGLTPTSPVRPNEAMSLDYEDRVVSKV